MSLGKKTARSSLLLLVCACCLSCGGAVPVITALDPKLTVVAHDLTIKGENFGEKRGESFVTIGGITPTASSYLEWSDTRIVLRVPDFGESGMVYVHRGKRRSKPVLVSSLAAMPVLGEARTSGPPVIESVLPASAAVGEFIELRGSGFGNFRADGAVLFTWAAEKSAPVPQGGDTRAIEAEADGSWNMREIRVRVPDGAASGTVRVRTAGGDSNAVPFSLGAGTGTKTLKDKRTYSIAYSVDVLAEAAVPPNSLYLRLPVPASTSSQTNKEALSLPDTSLMVTDLTEPDMETGLKEGGVTGGADAPLYRLTDMKAGDIRRIAVSYLVDVYAAETRPEGVRPNDASAVSDRYTKASALVPSGDDRIRAEARRIAGSGDNPYQKAYSIYRGLLTEYRIRADAPATRTTGALATDTLNATAQASPSLVSAIQTRLATPYTAALLFTAFCRAAGVPAVPVAGVLCGSGGSAANHYWAQFWVDGLGWVPVDPALGAGALDIGSFGINIDDRAGYYFGNLDNRHLAFSVGEATLSPVDALGRTSGRGQTYAFQNIWEEASAGIDAYSSFWSDINIVGVYSN